MKPNRDALPRELALLARLHGVRCAYRDGLGHRIAAPTDSVLAVLQTLGAPLHRLADAADAVRVRRMQLGERLCEPVWIAWNGWLTPPPLRIADPDKDARLSCTFTTEDGAVTRLTARVRSLPLMDAVVIEGVRHTRRIWRPRLRLPLGYHAFTIEVAGRAHRGLVIAAPDKVAEGVARPTDRRWGVYAPLYALWRKQRRGGVFSDLATLVDWVADIGGGALATLPLLATPEVRDEGIAAPSPYSPESRCFWSELYIDTAALPELDPESSQSPSAGVRAAVAGAATAAATAGHWRVDPNAIGRHTLRTLRRAAANLFGPDAGTALLERRRLLTEAAASDPELTQFARYRAARRRTGRPWTDWPAPARAGCLQPEDVDEDEFRTFLYAHWVARDQLATVGLRARERGVALYLDLPVGVAPDSFDVWRRPHVFCRELSTGAPPDSMFRAGQNWHGPPLHPEQVRLDGYAYLRACLREHLNVAGALRLDHVMGIHRLFVIPSGAEANRGVYLHYRASEQLAVICLESQRHGAAIVGEDLGIVPRWVEDAIKRHRIRRMFVGQAGLSPPSPGGLRRAPADAVAYLTTHDTPTFAGWWQGTDLETSRRLGWIDAGRLAHERRQREASVKALRATAARRGRDRTEAEARQQALLLCLTELARSPAADLLVNLEDLWGECEPQNVPGTLNESPNWRHGLRYSLDELRDLPIVTETLAAVAEARRATRRRDDEPRKP